MNAPSLLPRCMRPVSSACLVVGALLVPAFCFAEPVTVGTWSVNSTPNNDRSPFQDGHSWDCGSCGVAWRMEPGSEYLHMNGDARQAVPFFWDNWQGGTDLGGTSDYLADHRFAYDGHEFSLDNGHGFVARSGDGTNALMVRLVGAESVRYWLWFEDLPMSVADADYQDRGFTWVERYPVGNPTTPPPGAGTGTGTGGGSGTGTGLGSGSSPAPVPEPASVILVAVGMAILATRFRMVRSVAARAY